MEGRSHPLYALAAVTTALLFNSPAHAVDLAPDGVSAHIGNARNGVASAGVDLLWDWDWQRRRSELYTAHTEFIVSAWRADAWGGGHQDYWHLTLLPVLRIRPGEGRSPWFFDAGIGISYMTKLYATPHNVFGSKWNFYDMLGAGYSFGARQQDEVELRFVHLSNGGFKDPNPGENFVQLRYAHRF